VATTANDRQVGGTHYASKYQHWDWIADIKLPYHPATASKYVDRWRQKDGREGLQKALHYLEKTRELNIVYTPRENYWDFFWGFVRSRNHPLPDAYALFLIQQGRWDQAVTAIQALLNETA
jgi:hypothetical protein